MAKERLSVTDECREIEFGANRKLRTTRAGEPIDNPLIS